MTRNDRQYTTLMAGAILVASIFTAPLFAQAGQVKGPSDNQGDGLQTYLATLPVEQVSTEEIAGLLFTREEEKLARDVYTALGAKWNLRIFANIAKSEQTHMDAVKLMLDRYQIADPAAGLAAGDFFDATLRLLYADLVAKGNLSIADALAVGATIEDLDLRDVTALIATSDNQDLDTVYQNLAKGSRNHLRSYVELLAMQNVAYVPLYLDPATFSAIIASEMERGMYDAAGVPIVSGSGSGVCDGTGQGAGNGGGNNGNAGGNGSGTCSCDGTCDGTCTCDGSGDGTCDGSGAGSAGNGNQGSNGNQGGGRP